MGCSLQREGRLAEAGDCYRRALKLDPTLFHAVLYQGWLQEELGDMAAAETWYRRAQALQADAPEPRARLAQLLRGKLPMADRDSIEAMLASPAAESPEHPETDTMSFGTAAADVPAPLPPAAPARVPLLFGLAQVLDAQGSYARAAECLAEANAHSRKKRRSEGRNYHRAAHSAQVDQLISGFTPQLFDRLKGAGDETRVPVFVFGMPRSGTTLVEQVLASHSRVHGVGETRVATAVFESIPRVLGRTDEPLSCLNSLDAAAVIELARSYLDGINQAVKQGQSHPDGEAPPGRPPPDRIVDKMPDNYLYVGMLSVLFPRATFISVRRDLRDVAVSCWMTEFRAVRWADDEENLAARCRDYRRLMAHWQAVLPVRMHEIAYERVIDSFDLEAPRLLAACGLDWEQSCGQFHQTVRPVRTASVAQVRQPLYRNSMHRWKHYTRPLAGLLERLGVEDVATAEASLMDG
jgi:tetratricopeptide (TPR) repeat protein